MDLLEEEFKDERELIMQRCLDNIQMGMSVPVSLRLLRKTLATYPIPSRSWFKGTSAKLPTICSQIEKLQRLHRMLDIVFADLASYHSALMSQSTTHTAPGNPNDTSALSGLVPKEGPSQLTLSSSLLPTIPMKRSRSIDLSLNDKRIQIKGKVGRMSHLKGVIERLDFLQFVLSRSSLTISYFQLQLLWRALGEEAVTNETLDQVVLWIDGMVTKENKMFTSFLTTLAQETDPKDPSSSSKLSCLGPRDSGALCLIPATEGEETSAAFEEGVLVKLFESDILPWVTRRDKTDTLNREPLAILCLKLFLLVNVTNKSLKVELDGSWLRVGQLSCMAVLWRMAVCCSDSLVHDAATSLLVEVHHRIPQMKFRNCDAIRGHILRISFRQLSIAMQSLRAGDSEKGRTDRTPERIDASTERWEGFSPSGSSSTEMFGLIGPIGESDGGALVTTPRDSSTSIASLSASVGSGPWDEWFDDGDILLDPKAIARVVARLIMLLLLYIQRFDQQPVQLITLQVLAGRDDSPVLTLTLRSTETVGTLRARVANHFKESPEVISLLKPGRSPQLLSGTFLGGGQERLEKNEITLRQAKFLPHDSVIARKKDVPTPTGPSRSPAEKSGPLTEDLITFQDLSGDLLAVIQPLHWLVSSVADETTLPPAGSLPTSLSLLQSTFQLPPFPLPVKSDMTLLPYGDSALDRNLIGMPSHSAPHPTAVATMQTQQTSGTDANLPVNGRLSDSLIPLLRQSPQHMDQLLAMLDGYLSTEIQGAACVNFDLSAAVWEVLQSLPTHPALLKQVRDMPYERTGGSIRVLLNLASPFRLLYVLQMVDSFLAEGDKGSGSAQTAQVSDWALQFLHMGGAEHLVHLIDCTIKLIKQENSEKREVDNQKERNSPQKSDGDATTLILGLLYRSLHRLLLLDPLYSRWQVSSQYSSLDSKDDKGNPSYSLYEYPPISSHSIKGNSKETTGHSTKAPPGLVLTCISTVSFVKAAMECVYRSESTGPGSAPLQALAENAFVLVMGLLTASEKGVEVLRETTSGSAALRVPVESSVHLLNSMTDAIDDTENDPLSLKSHSVSKQSLQEIEMSTCEIPSIQQWIRCLCLTHEDKQVRRKICHCVFNVLANIFYLTADPAIKKEEKAQKMLLFDCIFHAVVCTAHAGYELCRVSDVHASQVVASNRPQATSQCSTRTASPASPVTSTLHQSEQIYSLLASLLSLRGVPRLIFPSNGEIDKSSTASLQVIPSEVHDRDAEILIDLFASQVQYMTSFSLQSSMLY